VNVYYKPAFIRDLRRLRLLPHDKKMSALNGRFFVFGHEWSRRGEEKDRNRKAGQSKRKSESRNPEAEHFWFHISAFCFLSRSVVIPVFSAPRRLGGDSLYHGDTEDTEGDKGQWRVASG
jgi:hypothetical protein